jgi:hypothetical protein
MAGWQGKPGRGDWGNQGRYVRVLLCKPGPGFYYLQQRRAFSAQQPNFTMVSFSTGVWMVWVGPCGGVSCAECSQSVIAPVAPALRQHARVFVCDLLPPTGLRRSCPTW